MRALGFLLMISGWFIVISAVGLLPAGPTELAFLLAALATQLFGLVLVARSHLPHGGRVR